MEGSGDLTFLYQFRTVTDRETKFITCSSLGKQLARGMLGSAVAWHAELLQLQIPSFAEALQEHLMPVLLCNVLAAWVSMLASGVAALQLPVRYVVTSESTVLDCVYLVPLISPEEGGPGATSIAKLAALQIFHDWMLKSWDRILCWYDKLCSLEADRATAGGVGGLIEERQARASLERDRKKHCIYAEAFEVELPVVMAAAEAVLGEAEMLAVVVSCEELPHHFNSPRRLPDNCQEDKYVAMRIHRHASLISRRKQLQSLSMSQTHTVSMLKQSIKSRLVFATVRRALQMDALGCCPDGLAILAFTDLATSSRIRSAGSRVKCEVSVPKAILLPLLDELLCTYDSFREALWPVEDPVLAYLSRSMGQQWNSSQENPVRRAADARVALPSFAIAIQHVMTSTILRQLRPNMMLDWALHVTDTEAQKRALRQDAKVDTSGRSEDLLTDESTQGTSQSPVESDAPNSSQPGGADDPWQSSSHSAVEGEGESIAAAQGAAQGAAAIRSKPVSLVEKVEQLAQYMPILAHTEVPCADAVFAKRRRDCQPQSPAKNSPSIAEHLKMFTQTPHQAAQNTVSPDSDVVRQVWGLPIVTLDDGAGVAQNGRCLASMPARKVTRDFLAVQHFAEQLPHHASGSNSQATVAFVYNAVWDRMLVLRSAAPARVWEQMLTQPASMFAHALSVQGRWETAKTFHALSITQQSLEEWGLQSRGSVSVSEVPQSAAPSAAPREDVVSDPKDAVSEMSVWQLLSRSATDADGQRAVRCVWAATTGLAKLSKGAASNNSRRIAWQKASPALLDLQLAVQDMSEKKRPAENPKWGDHRAHRTALHMAKSRVNEIKGFPPPLEGPLGPFATPAWLVSAASTSPRTAGSAYQLPALQASGALQSTSQTPEWLQAKIAHAWSGLRVVRGEHSDVSQAAAAVDGGVTQALPSVWSELLPSDLLGEHSDTLSSSKSEQSVPGPLRHYEFEEEVLFAWDSIASGEHLNVTDLRSQRDVTPIDGMGVQVWDTLLNDAALLSHRIKQVWSCAHAAASVSKQRVQQYSYPFMPALNSSMSRRRAAALKAWAALQSGAGQKSMPSSGGVRGSRFNVIRDSMDVAAKSSLDSIDQIETAKVQRVPIHSSSRTAQLLWQRHCNQVSAGAAKQLRSRADSFSAVWPAWDESWLKSSKEMPVDTLKGSAPAATIDVFSVVPEDSNAAFRRLEVERQALYADDEDQTSVEGNSSGQQHPNPNTQLSFSSTHTTSRKAHEQLQVLAELLLMHSQLHSRLSPHAWFPADRFSVQFQQHKSGKFVFRKPTDGPPEDWPSLQVKSAQPVLTCVGSVLFGMSPGLTMSNKPSAHKHHVSATQRALNLIGGAAILAAVPGVAAIASLSSGKQPSWMQHVPGTAWAHRLSTPLSVQPEAPQGSLPVAISSTQSGTGADSPVAEQQSAVSVRQQVAMAKDLMLQLRECLWYGIETPKREQYAYPAVFHVSLSPEGSVLDIAPLSGQARKMLPRLPIVDSIFSPGSAEKLLKWRAQFCDPSSKSFDPSATLPFTPRRKAVQVPADAVLLELTVYPDATRPSPESTRFLDNLSKPFRYLAAQVRGTSVESSSSTPEAVEAASTIVVVPLERIAASLVRAAFDSAMLEYGPSTIFDLQTEGLEKVEFCTGVVASLLQGSGDSRVDEATARLEVQLKEYNELCSLRNHDSSAPVGKEQLLMEICRTCTARYHMVLQQAQSHNGSRPVRAVDHGGEQTIAPVQFGPDWWGRVQQ